MKLEYKILWLDDKKDVIVEGEYQREIEEYLIENGFTPSILLVKNEQEFFEHLNDSFDLIMTDYHLNESENGARDGDKIIEEVRGKSVYTEIMFYSAQGEVADTIKMDRITFVDTRKIVGGDHYEKLIEKSIQLIGLTIRKFQNIVSMRGMIMNETSFLDLQMIEIIDMALANHKIGKDIISKDLYDEILTLFSRKIELVKSCRDTQNLKKLIKDNFVFSSEFKIKSLSNILDHIGQENFSSSYRDEVIKIRNKFAHAKLLKDEETGREYFKHGQDGVTFDDTLCKRIRKDITKHKANFTNLIPHVRDALE